jgi:hypothetical protein
MLIETIVDATTNPAIPPRIASPPRFGTKRVSQILPPSLMIAVETSRREGPIASFKGSLAVLEED